MFRTQVEYFLELLMSETMQLTQRTKNKVNKDQNGGNMSYLEMSEVALVHCNIANNDSRVILNSY